MESIVAMLQPIGQEHQMPVAEFVIPDRTKDKTTRRIRSVKVAAINCFIALVPRRMPSATSLAETAK